MLTKLDVEQAVPASLKNTITQQFVDTVNNVVMDPVVAEQVRENFLSYTGVLKDGKYKTQDYLNAVVYVSYKLMGDSNHDAYCKTFPQRHAGLVAAGKSKKDISSYVSMYAGNKLVNAILEQSFIPTWVLNRDVQQKAINHLATLMTGAMSEKVQCDAAAALLTHLAKPKEVGPLINFDLGENSGMNEMRDALTAMAQKQQEMIKAGMSTREIAGERIIQGEVVSNV